MRTIMVPLDGSALSEQAIPYAEELAKASAARLLLMRAILTAGSLAPSAAKFNTAIREEARDYLAEHVAKARGAGLTAEPLVVEDEAGYAILAAIRMETPDLVVMSTHGRGGLGRVVWGSVADQMLHQSSVPILLVPRSVDADWARGTPPRLILPLDGSPLAEEALEPAEELARTLGAEVVLVRAVDPTTWLMGTSDPWGSYQPYAAEILAETNEAAAKYLDSVATNLLSKGIPSSVAVVDGHAPSVIRQVAQDNHARAIVMATHGRGGAKRLLVGSVTDAVIRSARVPVLVVRPVAAPKHAVDHTTALLPARDERSLTVRMSPKEVEVVRTALQYLIGGNQAGERAVEAFDVLERFQRVGPRAEATASGSR